jgi:ATP-binding cassette subfamily B multidrug efflux pump
MVFLVDDLIVLRFFENLLNPYPDSPPRVPPNTFFAFLLAGTEGLRMHLIILTILSGIIGAFEAGLFQMLGWMVDTLTSLPRTRLWADGRTPLILFFSLLFSSIGLVTLHTLIKHQAMAGNYPMRLRWNFHRLMLGQSLAFYQDEFAGRVSAKVMQTALAVRDFWFSLTDILVFVGTYFLTLGLVVGSFHPLLLLPLIGWLTLYIIAIIWFVPRLAEVGKHQADARSMMTGRITDAYTNISTVKLFSHSAREADYARGAMKEFIGAVHGQMRLVSGLEVTNHTLSMLLISSTTCIALWLWAQGDVGVGAVATATALALRLNGLSHWVMWEMAGLFENMGVIEDGMNTLARPPKVVDDPLAKPLRVSHGDVRFEDVCFNYGELDQYGRKVFDFLNLHIHPGEKIGLVGRSGAGKSTLVNLLLRFYDLQSGRILIDGEDISNITQESLRAQIGMVTQDTSLLHRSVRDNILYGRPDASEAELIRAAERAEATSFIGQLVDAKGRRGFDAHVGERGVKLSGGQRQRIALARVLLKDAKILLLDEATSALDSEVESVIQSSLSQLMEGKTVIAIAHRLSTIAAMDRLVVMDEGRIVEVGDHASLLQLNGLYARLWAHQSGGFLGEEITH